MLALRVTRIQCEFMKKSHRPIRSYVLREGRMTPAQQRALTEHWPRYGLQVTDGLLDPKKVFGRDADLVLEIGFGMGQSLLAMAKQNPGQDFVGVEVHRPGIGALLVGMVEQEVDNIRIYQIDAKEVLSQCIADESLSKILIFFPDPWPKKRHHKRRLIQPEFVDLLIKKLKPGGLLHLATDWENYAEQMMDVLSSLPKLKNMAGDKQFSVSTDRPETKFERRGRRLGHGVWDLIFSKQDSGDV